MSQKAIAARLKALEALAAFLEETRDNLDRPPSQIDPGYATFAVSKTYVAARDVGLIKDLPEGPFTVKGAQRKLDELRKKVRAALAKRRWPEELIQRLSAVNTFSELRTLCEEIRQRFHTGGGYWPNAPEILRAISDAMERIGGSVPPRPSDVIQLTPGEAFAKSIITPESFALEERFFSAINQAVEWCERRAVATEAEPKGPDNDDAATETATHGPDFRSVKWPGPDCCFITHCFTETQAACVKVMWEAWAQGTPEVGQHTILEEADSDSDRLDDLFRTNKVTHPAWGTMIVPGSTKGSFRLQEPDWYREKTRKA